MFHNSLVKRIIKKVENLVFVFWQVIVCSQPWNKFQKSYNTSESSPKIMLHSTKCPKWLHVYSTNQYFEVMALALRTLKSDHFAFRVCSLKHDVISCSNFLTNFSLSSVAIRVPNHISSMFLVLKLSQFVLGGSYFFVVLYYDCEPTMCLHVFMSYSLFVCGTHSVARVCMWHKHKSIEGRVGIWNGTMTWGRFLFFL